MTLEQQINEIFQQEQNYQPAVFDVNLQMWKLDCYENHRRGKNWIAAITDYNPKNTYKFERKFKNITKIDNEAYTDFFNNNTVYQFEAAYYSGGGHKSTTDYEKYNGFYLFKDLTFTKIISEKEAIIMVKKLKEEKGD